MPKDMNTDIPDANVSRRTLMTTTAAASGGLLLGFALPSLTAEDKLMAAVPKATDINAFVRIDPDNTITVLTGKTEMGQGNLTGIAMLVAEELEADWSAIKVETAPSLPQYGSMITGGSSSITSTFEPLRKAGAAAREMLRQAAAAKWKVNPADTRAENGVVYHNASKRKASYGELAPAAAKLAVPADIFLKDPKAWKLIGKPNKRLDAPSKTDGTAVYGIDTQVPGMLIGSVRHCPTFGGKLAAVDEAPAMAIKGVSHVVKLENAVVVLANNYWTAQRGLESLRPEWDLGEHASANEATISKALDNGLKNTAEGPKAGDVDAALAGAAKTVTASYEVPYLSHSPMEPMNATVWVQADKVDVWASIQAQTRAQNLVAAALKIEPAKVMVYTAQLGGGFGRRLQADYIVEAALVSKAVGKPVKLVWSREEDTRHSLYRPRAKVTFKGGVDKAGKPVAMKVAMAEHSVVGSTIRANLPQRIPEIPGLASGWMKGDAYNVPNMAFTYADTPLAVPVGAWRSVQFSHNGFFGESMIDELAHLAGKDPLQFRIENATNPRYIALLEKVRDMSGWGARKLPQGHGLGVAMVESFGSIVAEVAEVSVKGKDVKLQNVWCAIDCGLAVFPDGVIHQMESCITYGLSAAFFGQITIDKGGVQQSNFDGYDMVRIGQAPNVEVAIINSGAKMGGAGEPGLPPVAPALANAIFAAAGERVRTLPLVKSGWRPV
ncbi:MAG: xanthine dehydrogenase family protein molybdopterin-binding subunit [Rhodospirillaceae bacterium]|nr:xanthine dehydrogenase family protein molybdopterin-binding subunit [Rhodospirillaceae bacterium]